MIGKQYLYMRAKSKTTWREHVHTEAHTSLFLVLALLVHFRIMLPWVIRRRYLSLCIVHIRDDPPIECLACACHRADARPARRGESAARLCGALFGRQRRPKSCCCCASFAQLSLSFATYRGGSSVIDILTL